MSDGDSRTGPVLLILLVLVLVGLFVIGRVLGGNGGAGCSCIPDTPAKRQALRDKWLAPPRVPASDVRGSGGCRVAGETINVTSECEVRVPASKGMSRDLVLASAHELDVDLVMGGDPKPPSVTGTVKASAQPEPAKPPKGAKAGKADGETSFPIPRDGATITLHPCKDAAKSCVVFIR